MEFLFCWQDSIVSMRDKCPYIANWSWLLYAEPKSWAYSCEQGIAPPWRSCYAPPWGRGNETETQEWFLCPYEAFMWVHSWFQHHASVTWSIRHFGGDLSKSVNAKCDILRCVRIFYVKRCSPYIFHLLWPT